MYDFEKKIVFLFSFWPWTRICKKFLKIQIVARLNKLKPVISLILSDFGMAYIVDGVCALWTLSSCLFICFFKTEWILIAVMYIHSCLDAA